MIKLNEIRFNNWIFPNDKSLQIEYNVEYQKHVKYSFGDIWKSFEDFKQSVKEGEIQTITSEFDRKISNRSRTTSYHQLKNLISSYKSWPKYRNERTLKKIYWGFKYNKPMMMPIILKINNYYRVMSGNSRMDVAFQLGINPKVIIINIR